MLIFSQGCILLQQIFGFAKVILRDRRNASYDLAELLHGRRNGMHRHEAVSCALTFPCLKEVSQNCFVFDVVNFES